MSEIKVEEYVRTKKGKIGKVIDIDLKNNAYYLDCNSCVSLENIKNHKEKLLELIEEGDYVNEMLVRKGRTANGEEKLLVGNHLIHGMALDVVNIKSIVTHEQFEKVMYKVGD